MNIGEAAQAVDLPAKTIRYYEEIGLVTPSRLDNGYRAYAETDVHKLRFLQRARSLGFSIEECRQLLSLYEDTARSSSEVKAIASAHLEAISTKIEELKSLHATLEVLVDKCHGHEHPECPILDTLADGPSIGQ